VTSYYIGWGTLALINAALANSSGRSPLKYFIASLLVGPFVTLLLAATREESGGSLRQVDLLRGQGRA
jgi:hypothetical protein